MTVSKVEAELRRRARIADMMLTAHSILRDRYGRRARGLDLLSFTVATVLVAATFVDPAVVALFRMNPDRVRVVVGFLSIALFLLTGSSLILDWKQKATRHQHAVRTLADVKAKSWDLLNGPPDRLEGEAPEFLRGAAFALSEIESIPEAEFVSLKARHKQKVELSRVLDEHPAMVILLYRLKTAFGDTAASLRQSTIRGDASKPADD